MFETATSLIGLPGAVMALWAVLIVALFFVTRGLSRRLAWAFVAGGLAVPVAVLQMWPVTTPDACQESVLADGDSADGRYAYRIVKSRCRGSSELAYRVDMGRKADLSQSGDTELRPVMRSYGFPRPVAVRQVADNHFLIFLTSDGRDQVPLRISLDPETGEPSYLHRFFQGHSDRSFTVSGLSEADSAPGNPQKSTGKKRERCKESEGRGGKGDLDATVDGKPTMTPRHSSATGSRSFRLRLTLKGFLPAG